MRIAFIGQKGIPASMGGVEKHVEELAVRLSSYGHEVFVYVRDNYTDKNLKKYKGVNLIHLPTISSKHLDAIVHTLLASIHAIFRQYDVVHYQAIGPSLLCWIIKFFKREAILLATYHCQDYNHQKWGKLAKLFLKIGEWMACNVPDKTIAISRELARYAFHKYKTKVAIIPNGANVKFYKNTDQLAKLNLKDKKYVLTVSRLIKHKGIHYLIESFKKLEDTGKIPNGMKLVIVGDGFHTDDYVKYLKVISEKRDNIIFTGALKGKALGQIFSHAYLFVQPSEYEGLSIALLEAMGYGLATIVSDIRENADVVRGAGLTFKNKDIVDLSNKLSYLINKPSEAEKLGKLGFEKVKNEYSWDSIARKTENLYIELLSKEKEIYVWREKKI